MCISSPVNHVLDEWVYFSYILSIQLKPDAYTVYRNQILFRITTVLPRRQPDGREVDLVVKRYLKLRETARASTEKPVHGTSAGLYDESSGAGVSELSLVHAELEAQRSDIERIDSAGFKVISGLDDAVNRVEGDLSKMRDTLSELRQELRGNHDDMSSLKTEIKDVKKQSQDRTIVKRLEEQLNSANDTVELLRHELSDLAAKFENELGSVKAGLRQNAKDVEDLKSLLRDRVTARDHAKDMTTVRGELAQLRKQMDESRAKPPEPFPSRELDILTTNIAKIGNRASQVESLQMEFEIFKGRVERMEAANQASQARQAAPASSDKTSAYDRYNDHDYREEELRSSRRKRTSPALDTSPLTGSSSKRAATSSDAADTVVATQWSQNTPSSPVTEVRTRADATRLTKGSKVDKRAPRPPRRSLIGISASDKLPHSKRRG
jgi:archaellum component FlaC